MAIAIALIVLALGSVLFHFLSPWYFTPIASNWGAIDSTIAITFWVTGFVFGPDVAAPRDVCVWYGVAFLFLSVSTPPIRNLLVPAGRVRLVLGWTLGSAVVGLVLMLGAAVAGWSAGVAAGMAVSEAVLLAGLLGPALHESRSATP